MIAPLPLRPRDFLRPAAAVLVLAAAIGSWNHTPDRWASARALDAAAWKRITFALPLIHGAGRPTGAKVSS